MKNRNGEEVVLSDKRIVFFLLLGVISIVLAIVYFDTDEKKQWILWTMVGFAIPPVIYFSLAIGLLLIIHSLGGFPKE